MAALTDIALVAQVAVMGNRRAFDELVRRYQSPVRRFLLNLTLGNSALSDDLAQDTFLKAYTAIRSFRGTASLQTWLMRIAYNVFYDHTRRTPPNLPEGEESLTESAVRRYAPPSEGVGEVWMDFYHALSLLKPDERTCVTLELVDGYDIASIARVTQLKEGTVKSHLSRGKEKLANYLKQNGYDRR